jgi:nitric oxide reductase NorD protein
MARTTGSIHGHHTTFPSPGLPHFSSRRRACWACCPPPACATGPTTASAITPTHPERQEEYFRLESADSRAVLQRERHGTLFADVERKLDLYLRALWRDSEQLVPYSTAFDELRKPIPTTTSSACACRMCSTMRGQRGTVGGLDRYRAVLAHMAGHRRWSVRIIADNWSPFQRMAVEFFEDCRIETCWCASTPACGASSSPCTRKPVEGACDPETTSCLRHRLAMLSRALLDPGTATPTRTARVRAALPRRCWRRRRIEHGARWPTWRSAYVARTRRQSDQFAKRPFRRHGDRLPRRQPPPVAVHRGQRRRGILR